MSGGQTLKITHVYKDFDPPIRGGMERHIALMCRYQKAWAEVDVLICSRTPRTIREIRDGIPVTAAGEWGRFQSAPASPSFPWHMGRLKSDVVVVHVPNPTAEISYLLNRPAGKLAVRYHSDVVRQAAAMRIYRPFLMHFLRQAAIILPTSSQYVESSPLLPALRGKCSVVPLGIVLRDFRAPDPARVADLKEKYGGPFVLFAGRHRYYKGLPILVKAAQHIGACVVAAGDGPERKACEEMARREKANMVFPGELSHAALVAHLHACSVFAFPSVARSEAFGMSILEAHACGKPVVATTLGTGVEFANLHGVTGLNVPPADPGALAEAINALLQDADRATRLGEQARQRVEREFQAEMIARREFEIYQEVAGCSSSSS